MNDSQIAAIKDQAAAMANYARAISAHCIFRLAGYCRGDCRGRALCKTDGLKVLYTPRVPPDMHHGLMAGLVLEKYQHRGRAYQPTNPITPEDDQDHEI